MNPYQATNTQSESVANYGLLFRANWIAGICALIFAFRFFLKRDLLPSDEIKFVPAGIWCVAAFLVFRFPRQLGVVIGLLMLLAVFMQHHFYEQMISNLKGFKTPEFEVTPEVIRVFWSNFWISVLPLIIGAPFAMASTWLSHRKSSENGEQEAPFNL